MATRKRAASKIYELYVALEDIEPLIWRRLLVPATITLPKLHDLLQLAMGWTNSHLHSCTIGKKTFGMADVDDFEELNMLDERKQTLEAALGDTIREFMYEYDFGDSWRHRIAVKPVARPNTDWHYPLCTGGARAAPPDDVGGPPGYEEFLAAIKDPEHEERPHARLDRRRLRSGGFRPQCHQSHATLRPTAPLTPRATVVIQAIALGKARKGRS